jgi:TolA-binding protein
MVGSFKNSQGNSDALRPVANDLKSLSDRVGMMEGVLRNIASKPESSGDGEKIKGLEQRINNLQNSVQKSGSINVQNLEQKVNSLQEDVKNMAFQAQEPLSVLNIQMSDMLGKIIAIEMRLAVAEKNLEKYMNVQPVVLE